LQEFDIIKNIVKDAANKVKEGFKNFLIEQPQTIPEILNYLIIDRPQLE
jgi:hypothetical protein